MSFTLPWTVNKLVSTNINDANSITDATYGTSSLKVNGKSLLVGNTVLVGNVGIGSNVSASHQLFVSGSIGSTSLTTTGETSAQTLTTTGRNSLSNVKFVTTTTSLVFGDPEYICISSNGSYNIYLPSATTAGIGTKFSFFLSNGTLTGTKSIVAAGTQEIFDGFGEYLSVTLGQNTDKMIELVCTSNSGGVYWTAISRGIDYSAIVYLPADNAFTGLNSFSDTTTFTGGITASGTQSITFGTNAPTMAGTNVSGVVKNTGTESIAGLKTFTDSLTVSGAAKTLTIPRLSTTALNTVIGSTVNVGNLVQNLNYDTTTRTFEVWNDIGTGQMFSIDTSNNTIQLSPKTININNPLTTFAISAPTTFTNSSTTFTGCPISSNSTLDISGNVTINGTSKTLTIPRLSTATLNTLVGGTVDVGNIMRNISYGYTANTLSFWSDAGASMLDVDISSNAMGIRPTNLTIYPSGATTFQTNTTFQVYGTTFQASPITIKNAAGDTSVALYANTTAVTINQLKFLNPLTDGIVDLSRNQTISGIKTFSSAPIFSGASITAASIPDSKLTSNIPLKNGTNTFTGSTNNFTVKLSGPTKTPNTNTTDVATTEYVYKMLRVANDVGNISVGENANPNNNGGSNFAMGLLSMQNAGATVSDCVAIGTNSLNALTSGFYNFALGGGAMQFAQTSTRCVAIGYTAMANGTSGNGIIAIGNGCSPSCVGDQNTSIGYYSCGALSTGTLNCVYGSSTGGNLTTGSGNCFYGNSSGSGIITGSNNSFFGPGTTSTGDYSNSSAIGQSATITANSQIILGTASEVTYPMGGLNIPALTTMTLLGNLVANSLTITPTIMGYIQGLTSSAQTQLDNILNGTSARTGTISFVNATFSGTLNTVSAATFAYISGLTSSAQTQLNNILNGTSAFTGTVGFTNATFSGTTITTGTATFNGILTTKGTYLKSCASIQTGSFTISSSLIYETYPINITATSTVTLPAASAALIGVTIRFRRVAGSAVALNSATSNIYPATSFTANAVLLTASNSTSVGNSMSIVCLQLSATPTYGWFDAA